MFVPAIVLAAADVLPAATKEENIPSQPQVPTVTKPSKIGALDVSYIGMESDFGKAIKARLTEKKAKVEESLRGEKKKLDTLKDSIESKASTYTAKQREAKSKDFQKKVEAFQKLVRESEESLMKEQGSETSKIFSLIEKTVTDYGKANDFAMIVVKNDILYTGNEIEPQDLTSIILKGVNDAWKDKGK
jgi:Skp family chaperone for outer membrane proteins